MFPNAHMRLAFRTAIRVAPFVAAVLLALGTRHWVVEIVRVPSDSMLPSIMSGDYVLVEKWATRVIGRLPGRGAVVVFRDPGTDRSRLIKRVIGQPGDRVGWHQRRVRVNGVPLQIGPFVPAQPQTTADRRFQYVLERQGDHEYPVRYEMGLWEASTHTTVQPGTLVVFGDNRDYSSDSRTWGALEVRRVVGTAHWILFSRDMKTGRIQWKRIGRRIP